LSDLHWVAVGNGRLAVYHRPGRRAVSFLKSAGSNLVVTLLKESEGGLRIGQWVQNDGMEWLWLPIQDGNPPVDEQHQAVAAAIPQLSERLDQGQSILIHCAAGIHRTGMVALALLRYRGLSEEDGMQIIGQSRWFTFDGLQARQKRYAATYAQAPESVSI
jgi:protein-tyrosine phosphatase